MVIGAAKGIEERVVNRREKGSQPSNNSHGSIAR
jgi:hypothetical protein